MKYNIIRYFIRKGVEIKVVPWDWDLSNENYHGLFISNGPGDPTMCDATISQLRRILEDKAHDVKPIFGICLGNQLLALAAGMRTYKMKFGNRGMNQPCMDMRTTLCYITPQNHGYAVDNSTLGPDWQMLFMNANDYSNEGLIHLYQPYFSVQFHPEAKGGPTDTEFLFDMFLARIQQKHAIVSTVVMPQPLEPIRKVLLLGSGGLSIGQAGEFDYSGSQAIKALKEENIFIVLINPNIATVQTSVGMADKVYFLPVTPDFVERVIEKEKPDGILLQFGGQTALNCGMALDRAGVLKKHHIRVLGTPSQPPSRPPRTARSSPGSWRRSARAAHRRRSSTGSEGVDDRPAGRTAHRIPRTRPCRLRAGWAGQRLCSTTPRSWRCWPTRPSRRPRQIIVDKSLKGWKEVEYEVVRDCKSNTIAVCNMENFDPLGIHTGDSIVVAPTQTLSNEEVYMLRATALKVVRHLGVVGECNIQYALDPYSSQYFIIEVNARLSRSSALASKATGYPLAYVAAKLSLGLALTDVKNSVTKTTTACFPECDTRVLTNWGWLFLGDIEELEKAGKRVLYACYDINSAGLVYRAGRRVLSAPPERWVDFTQAGTRRQWDASSDDYGSTVAADGVDANRLTVRTTPDHRMYVQPCLGSEQRIAGRSPIGQHLMSAQELAPGYQCDCSSVGRTCPHGYSHYRMVTGAAGGLQRPTDVPSVTHTSPHSPVAALGLRTADELDAFLELFGFWLGDGTMQYLADDGSVDGVAFSQRKGRDDEYLRDLIVRLGLIEGVEWRYNYNKKYRTHIFYIIDPRWFRFFDAGFGMKYQGSPRYNREQALLNQGMHSMQQRPHTASWTWTGREWCQRCPSAASTVSASAPVSVASPTRARAVSVSTSDSVELVASSISRSRSSSSSSSSDGLASSSSFSFSFTPRSRSTSVVSATSLQDAMATAATMPEPYCLLCGRVESLSRHKLSAEWHCTDCIASVIGAAGESGVGWSDDEEEKMSTGSWSDAQMELHGHVDIEDNPHPIKEEWSPPPLEPATPPPPADVPSEPEEDDDPPEKKEPPMEDDPPTSDDDDDEDDPLKSAKWLPDWVVFRLSAPQLRLVLEGLRQADGCSAATTKQRQAAARGGSAFGGKRMISTSSVAFRDQLVQACLHAGYSAHFVLNTRAGSVRGYNAVPADGSIYTKEEMEAALQVHPTRQFRPVRTRHDNWWVCYTEAVKEWIPAQDVRFDGTDCSGDVRQRKKNQQGWVAVHCNDKEEVKKASTLRELAGLLSVNEGAVRQAASRGNKIGRYWYIFSAAAYEKRSGQQRPSPVIPTQPGDLYNEDRDGRVWCVNVDHPDHLIVVQRAHCNARGVVTKVGRSIVIGNCFEPALDYLVVKIPRWDMKKFNHVSDLIGSAMKSVGEVMAVGRTFEEAFQKAIRMVDGSLDGFGDTRQCLFATVTDDMLDLRLKEPSDERVMAIALAYQRGYSIQRVWELTKIDKCQRPQRLALSLPLAPPSCGPLSQSSSHRFRCLPSVVWQGSWPSCATFCRWSRRCRSTTRWSCASYPSPPSPLPRRTDSATVRSPAACPLPPAP